MAAGGPLLITGAARLAGWESATIWACALGLMMIAGGVLLMAGLLTSQAGAVGAVSAASLLLAPQRLVIEGPVTAILVAVIAAALALLGPGAISIDARLFGRREIIIPHSKC